MSTLVERIRMNPNSNVRLRDARFRWSAEPNRAVSFDAYEVQLQGLLRADQYANAWQTLSPATRRRLEPYITQQPSSLAAAMPAVRAQQLARKRAAMRVRSYSADEQVEEVDAYGRPLPPAALPHIKITGASSSEGQGSIIDYPDEEADLYGYGGRSNRNRLRRYYQERSSSRAHSEPDLRVDQRYALLMDGTQVRQRCRLFLALYDYDPYRMSPNPNAAQEELSFRKGQVIRVYGEKDEDGFYRGEHNGRMGLVPSNMVAEMDKDEALALSDMRMSAPGASPIADPYGVDPYDPYYNSRSSGGRFRNSADRGMVAARRRQSDTIWSHHNNSDPSLVQYRGAAAAAALERGGVGGGYSDYDSTASADRYSASGADPRLRRLKFQQNKSHSYDYDTRGRRRPAAPEMEPGDYRRRAQPQQQQVAGGGYGSDYERDRDRQPPGGYARDGRDADRAAYTSTSRDYRRGDEDYRGSSLDRRTYRTSGTMEREPLTNSHRDRTAADAEYRKQYPYDDRLSGDDYYDDYSRRRGGGAAAEPKESSSRAPYGPAGGGMRSASQDRAGPPGSAYYDDRDRPRDYRDRGGAPRYDTYSGYDSDRMRGDGDRGGGRPPPRDAPPRDDGYGPRRGNGTSLEGRDRYPGTNTPPYDRRGPPVDQSMPPPQQQQQQPPSSFRGGSRDHAELAIRDTIQHSQPRRMFARYEYDSKASPNVDAEVELSFRAGDCITVYGEMDEDGFYVGELNGKRGLVPSNFLADQPPPAAQQLQPASMGGGGQQREMMMPGGMGAGQMTQPQQPQMQNNVMGMQQMSMQAQPQQITQMQPQMPQQQQERGVKFVDDGGVPSAMRAKPSPARQQSTTSSSSAGQRAAGGAGGGGVGAVGAKMPPKSSSGAAPKMGAAGAAKKPSDAAVAKGPGRKASQAASAAGGKTSTAGGPGGLSKKKS